MLVEKPIAATSREAEELCALAERMNLKLQVGHVERFNPAFQSARAKITKPLFIEGHRLAPFKVRSTEVDVVLDLMIHDLDVVLSLVRSEPTVVLGVGSPVLTKTLDIANARIEFANGAVANLTASRVSQTRNANIRIFQPDQYVSIDFQGGEVNVLTKTGPLVSDQMEDIPLEHETMNLEKGDALMLETRAFVDAIVRNEPVLVSGRTDCWRCRWPRGLLKMPSADSAKPKRILIVAAETSSCLYAQRLLEHWKQHNVSVEAFGIGNQAMIDLGFKALARAEELAVVGVQEVIAHWPVIKKAFYDVLDAVREREPAVVLLLDYPDFNLRLAKKLKALNVPVVYYISPQVWAWRRGRVKLIARVIDKMLVVFPFEVDFYAAHGVKVEFVGHPLLDELDRDQTSTRALRRAKYGLGDGDVLLALMPGSRRSEIKHHLTTQLATARRLVQANPRLRVGLFVAPNFDLDVARGWLEGLIFLWC